MDKRSVLIMILIVAVALVLGRLIPGGSGAMNSTAPATVEVVRYSDVNQMLDDSPKSVKSLTFVNGSHEVIVAREGKPTVTVKVPDGGEKLLMEKADKAAVPVDAKDTPKSDTGIGSILLGLLFTFGPILLIAFFFVWMARQAGRNASQMQAQLSRTDANKSRVDKKTFADVAGCDEAIKKLRRVVRFLRHKDAFNFFGARLPKGVLLIGPAGTGKTLLAKAVAGETDATFLSMSGSEFVEMFVGVGAARVRDLFAQARALVQKTKKPVILFIDEIDAVGGKRGAGISGGGHQEREQTLNQILVEMDGVEANAGIIVMAATNRVDILDSALIRPGRFDYKVLVDLPDLAGREKIFAIHTRGKKLAADVDLRVLAARTWGYSGADIEASCNEAAILAVERVEEQVARLRQSGVPEPEIERQVVRGITLMDFDEGIDTTQLGEARRSRQATMTVDEKKNTAYHEACHAWVSQVVPGGDPIVKVTIVPRERALGYTQAQPDGDRLSFTEQQARARIMMAMGGRIGQEVFLGTVDTGASNDFLQATRLAKRMVTEWGMSKLGHISVGGDSEGPFMGMGGGPGASYGPALADEIDREWRQICEQCYKDARRIIERDKDSIEKIVQVLLAQETILAPQWNKLVSENPPSPDVPAPAPTEAPAAPALAVPAEPKVE